MGFGLCLFWIMFSTLVWGANYGCESHDNAQDCVGTEAAPNPCIWNGTRCNADCAIISETDCAENSGCSYITLAGCFDDEGLKINVTCEEVTIRAQCFSLTETETDTGTKRSRCYWRAGAEANWADRDSGTCVGIECSLAADENECEIFKNVYRKPCRFYPGETEEGLLCRDAKCEDFDNVTCKSHGVPNLFCDVVNNICTDTTTKSCENSGAEDHASCLVANDYISGVNCFYTDGCKTRGTVSCGQLNLEECETLSFEYMGISCKVQSSECIPVTRCDDTKKSTTELECASNSSETNPCFYLNSLPPSGNVQECVFRDTVQCEHLKTQSKCIFHGIEGLHCQWNGNACSNKNVCEMKSKEDCVRNTSCFFALDADSYFHGYGSIEHEKVTGHCYTKSSNGPRSDCAKYVNPNQCNSQKTENDTTTVQDCLYSQCFSTSQATACEGKCVPWSMKIIGGENMGLENRDDCMGITDQSQCRYSYRETSLYVCNFINNYCSPCQAPHDENQTTSPLPCHCETNLEGECKTYEDCECKSSFVYEMEKCDHVNATEAICNSDRACVWFDKSCRFRKNTYCEMITTEAECKTMKDSSNQVIDGLNCTVYPVYFEPGYREKVDWRCKEYVSACGDFLDSTQCNDAGSGDGQTCFWLEKLNSPNLGECVPISEADPITCDRFEPSQCPVTDEKLLPFVGANTICKIYSEDDGTGNFEKCVNSSFISIPNYCAQFTYDAHSDLNYDSCNKAGMCLATDIATVNGVVEGVCLPDSAKQTTCDLFTEEKYCHYVEFENVGVYCEYLSQNQSTTKCVDANFVQCEDLSEGDCLTGFRAQTDKCIYDTGCTDNERTCCKINRCLSATKESICTGTQNGKCSWDGTNCIKRLCRDYAATDCPAHCSSEGGCKSYENCGSVTQTGAATNITDNNCTNALPEDKSRCYIDATTLKCTQVSKTKCEESTIENECLNLKPSDGYACKWNNEPGAEKPCELKDPPTCQSITPDEETFCVPAGRLFAVFSEFCDFVKGITPGENKCRPTCAAIENGADCLREVQYCDLYAGNKCKNIAEEADDCTNKGFAACTGRCQRIDNATIDNYVGCEIIPDPPAQDNSKMNLAVIIGSVVGGVVILLLIIGIIVVILLYIRMKKKHEEEEERLRREAEAEAAEGEDEGELGYGGGGGGGGGGESKGTSMNANPDEGSSSSSSSGNDSGANAGEIEEDAN